MRILFTTTSGVGHFHPLVPLAKAAADAGHDVAFASPASLSARIEATGFQAFATEARAEGPDPERAEVLGRIGQLPPGDEVNVIWLADVFVGIGARRAMPALVELCKEWKPDLIVREDCEFSGAIAAEHLGLPHATVQVSYAFDWMRLRGTAVAQRLDEVRAEWSLPPDPELAMLFRHLLISFDPPSFVERANMPATAHHLRADLFDRSDNTSSRPEWLTDAEHPIIYMTLGTEAPRMPWIFPGAYTTILAGLHDIPGTVVVTIGRERDPAELGEQPPHIHVERYIPQSLLLPECDMVITHGGHNTVLAALNAGLPLVVTPFFADQLDNGARCAELEIGRMVSASQLSAESVREAVQALLDDNRYRDNAVRLCTEMASLPGLDYGIELLEKLASEPAAVSTTIWPPDRSS